jgi:GNAT superfamily N-acetyltransferase
VVGGSFYHAVVGQLTDSYRIRLARPDEVPRLREIEDEAGRVFSGLGLIDEALDVSVLPAHSRRGLGARLLARVCAWAKEQGHSAVTLSTFRDVPWNGPFYRKHGFRDLQPSEWTPGMRTIREQEAQHGLRVEARVFMRRDLGGT